MSDEISKRLGELSDHLDATDAPEGDELRGAMNEFSADGDHHALRERFHNWLLRWESSHPEMSRVMARVLESMPGV